MHLLLEILPTVTHERRSGLPKLGQQIFWSIYSGVATTAQAIIFLTRTVA